MVVFSELRVTHDGDKLIIDAFIDTSISGDENQKIDQIWVDKNIPVYREGCPAPSNDAVLIASTEEALDPDDKTEFDPAIIDEALVRGYRIEVPYGKYSQFNIANDMLHVYVVTSGQEEKDCECNPVIGTVVNIYPYYQLSLYYMREMQDSCVPPRDFIDFILKLKSVEIAIKTGNYDLAHQQWEMLRRIKKFPVKHCKCNHNGVIS